SPVVRRRALRGHESGRPQHRLWELHQHSRIRWMPPLCWCCTLSTLARVSAALSWLPFFCSSGPGCRPYPTLRGKRRHIGVLSAGQRVEGGDRVDTFTGAFGRDSGSTISWVVVMANRMWVSFGAQVADVDVGDH